jgi:hypothetical protein
VHRALSVDYRHTRPITGVDVQFPYFARERPFLPSAQRIAHAAREVLDSRS